MVSIRTEVQTSIKKGSALVCSALTIIHSAGQKLLLHIILNL